MEKTFPSSNQCAKVAGYMYLFGMAASIFAELALRSPLMVRGNASETALNIMAHETQFRTAIALDFLTYISVVLLVWALYVLLKPVNRNLALLGAFLRLVEVSFFYVFLINNFAVLKVLGNDEYLKVFEAGQLQAMSRVALLTKGDAYNIGFSILGLGSAVFSYLLFKSNYIPKVLAGFGVFASALFFVITFVIIIFPSFSIALSICYGTMFIYEVGLGLWFVIKGVKVSEVKS